MNRQLRAQVSFSVHCAMAGVAVVCAFVLLGALPSTPDPHDGPDPFVSHVGEQVPRPGPTGTPRPHLHVPITALIVQQNPTCWTGVPGETCTVDTPTEEAK